MSASTPKVEEKVRRLYLLLAMLLVPGSLRAEQVTNLAAVHRSGQTFITWTSPAGQGWTYRLYTAPTPIVSTSDLDAATLVGSVGDSTWCNRRLTRIKGRVFGYAIDSLAAPLDSTRGLFVVTPATSGNRFYAVTAEAAAQFEDKGVTPGQNSLTDPVAEIPSRPKPVYQDTTTSAQYQQMEVYTLWTSPVSTPDFPAMANRWGEAYDCGIRRGSTGIGNWHALAVSFHVRGGNYTQGTGGTGMAGEWSLTPDDFTRNQTDVNTWWFGYHEDYDIEMSGAPPPTSGQVVDFTRRRVSFTIEWALDNFPVDRSRVYALGSSMGGTGALMFAFWRPDLITATYATIPRVNFAHAYDPNSYPLPPYVCSFNPNQGQRVVCDRLWGTLASNLQGPEGRPVYESLSGPALAAMREPDGSAPMMVFSGRQDATIGWAEKPEFYQAMASNRQGGIFFWDQSGHSTSESRWVSIPMNYPSYLYRFRSDRSFPALSNCGADNDPGDGTHATGDTLGVINAFVEWDTLLTDTQGQWQIRLTLRDLITRWGPFPAPESLTVDVTPRRLQQFVVTPGGTYAYEVRRFSDDAVVQTGDVIADSLGLITVPAVRVYKVGGSRLTVTPSTVGVDAAYSKGRRQWLVAATNPVRYDLPLEVHWPGNGPAELVLFNLSGERVGVFFNGVATASPMRIHARVKGMSPGIYFVQARQAGMVAVARIAIVR